MTATSRPSPSPRSRSSSRAPTGYRSISQNFGDLEDLHRFPLESLHSFSFAQQSEELLHSRQNILKRSIDFMRDRMGWAATNPGIANAQANVSGNADIQTMMDLLNRAHVLDEETSSHARGPITGPAEVNGDNIFEKAFSDHGSSPISTRDATFEPSSGSQATSESSQLLSTMPNDRILQSRRDLIFAPSSRRVSLKRPSFCLPQKQADGYFSSTVFIVGSLRISGLLDHWTWFAKFCLAHPQQQMDPRFPGRVPD